MDSLSLLDLLDTCFKQYTLETIRNWIEETRLGIFDADSVNVMEKDLISTLDVIVEEEYQRIGQKHNTVTLSGLSFIEAAEELFYKFKYKEDVEEWHVETLDKRWTEFQSEIGWGKALDDAKHREIQSAKAQKKRSIIRPLVSHLVKTHSEETPASKLWPLFIALLDEEGHSPDENPSNRRNPRTWSTLYVTDSGQKSIGFRRFSNLVCEERKKLSR